METAFARFLYKMFCRNPDTDSPRVARDREHHTEVQHWKPLLCSACLRLRLGMLREDPFSCMQIVERIDFVPAICIENDSL